MAHTFFPFQLSSDMSLSLYQFQRQIFGKVYTDPSLHFKRASSLVCKIHITSWITKSCC